MILADGHDGPQCRVECRPGAGDVHLVVESTDFDAFYHEHRDQVGRALAFTLADRNLGFEAVDEAMARAFQRWGDVSAYANPAGWVYRTGLNWATSFLRRHSRSRKHRNRLASPHHDEAQGNDVDLHAALGRLSADHRAVVVLRFYCDWSVGDTAAALGIPPGTVKSRLARALDQLRSYLDDPMTGPPNPSNAGRRTNP